MCLNLHIPDNAEKHCFEHKSQFLILKYWDSAFPSNTLPKEREFRVPWSQKYPSTDHYSGLQVNLSFVRCFLHCHLMLFEAFFVQTASCYMHTSQCGIYSTYTYHCLRIRRSKVEDSQNLEKVSKKMTYSKKQKITENNEKHSNRPVGRCSGPLLDIFGSTEPWTHALSEGCWREKLNLNILVSINPNCQVSAFKVHIMSS